MNINVVYIEEIIEMKRIIIAIVVILIVAGCKEKTITEKPKIETPQKMVCTMFGLGENKATFQYIGEKLITFERSYIVEVNEKEIKKESKEWNEYITVLDRIEGIDASWKVSDDRKKISALIIVNAQNVAVDVDLFEADFGIYYLLRDNKDIFHLDSIEKEYKSDEYTCEYNQ